MPYKNPEDARRRARERFQEKYHGDPDWKKRHNQASVAWRKKNPEAAREIAARWRDENRDKLREMDRNRSPEEAREAQRRYREKNRDEIRQRGREGKRRKRAQNDPITRQHIRADRFRRRHGIATPPEAKEYMAILAVDPCSYCGGRAGTIDHIEPLTLGGAGDADNLTAACAACNTRKSNLPLLLACLDRHLLRGVGDPA